MLFDAKLFVYQVKLMELEEVFAENGEKFPRFPLYDELLKKYGAADPTVDGPRRLSADDDLNEKRS